ncbi:MAG TPA: hypothetical protein VE523_07955 [Solirubrobacterales bacterium]|nr:hypothetical protein [Solirubrobacterales bacterium]
MILSRITRMRDTARGLKRVHDAGGPKRVRLLRVERPKGWIIPTATAVVDVETESGDTVRIDPALPVPFLFAWAYRLARKLGVPLVSDVDPDDVSFAVPLPSWAWPGGR